MDVIMTMIENGKTYGEISKITGYSRSAVAGHVNRNRKTRPSDIKIAHNPRHVKIYNKWHNSISEAARDIGRSQIFVRNNAEIIR